MPNQLVCGAVVSELRFILAVELRNDPFGQYFAELHAPLVEGVNFPNGSLRKNIVFIESNQFPEHVGRQFVSQNHIRRPIAVENAMRHQPIRGFLGFHLVGGLSESQRFCLRDDVGKQHIVMRTDGIQGFSKANKIARNQASSLMDELIKRMLTVCAGLAPVSCATALPSSATCFPLLSMVSCWRYAGKRLRYCSYGMTPTVWAPKKSLYQTASKPRITGMLSSKGAVRKCSSIS